MTPLQAKAYAFIKDHIAARGFSPSYEEIAAHVGVRAKSSVSRIVDELVRDGVIRRSSRGHRSLELADPNRPDAVDLAKRLARALMKEHGFDDGDGPMIVGTEAEIRATLFAALNR